MQRNSWSHADHVIARLFLWKRHQERDLLDVRILKADARHNGFTINCYVLLVHKQHNTASKTADSSVLPAGEGDRSALAPDFFTELLHSSHASITGAIHTKVFPQNTNEPSTHVCYPPSPLCLCAAIADDLRETLSTRRRDRSQNKVVFIATAHAEKKSP